MLEYPYCNVIDINNPKTCLAYRYAKKINQKDLADLININACMLSSYETGCVIGEYTKKHIQNSLAEMFTTDFADHKLVIQLVAKLIYLSEGNDQRLYELLFELTHEYIITSS